MKKSVVAGLIILALIVLISPGLVGKLAERSVDGQLEWATRENREFDVTAGAFERRWFSSEGVHRLSFAATPAGIALREQMGVEGGDDGPALIIETHLDHGLVPVTSLQGDSGSLMPGLGRAESRLRFEAADGEITDLPGAVITHIGLTGGVTSRYELIAGESEHARWGAIDVRVKTDSGQQHYSVDISADALEPRLGPVRVWEVADFVGRGDFDATPWGFSVGDARLSIGSLVIGEAGEDLNVGPFESSIRSALAGERVHSEFDIDTVLSMGGEPESRFEVEGSFAELHGPSLGRLTRSLKNARGIQQPGMLMPAVDVELKALLANGLKLDIDRLEITRPEGTMLASLAVELSETDPDEFTWAGVLLDTEASWNLEVPAALFDAMVAVNPDLETAAALGFLKKEGESYTMQALYKKGLLTINGAPMPVPLPPM